MPEPTSRTRNPGAQGESLYGGVDGRSSMVVILVEGRDLRGREGVAVADAELAQFVVYAVDVVVYLHRLYGERHFWELVKERGALAERVVCFETEMVLYKPCDQQRMWKLFKFVHL